MKKTNGVLGVQKFAVALGVLAFVSACTKEREASFPDGAADNVYEISKVQGASVTITTAQKAAALSDGESLLAAQEVSQVAVVGAEGPAFALPMFKNLVISGAPGATYTVKFKVDPSFVSAYKVVDSRAELSTIEKEIASDSEEGTLVPLFQAPVSQFGVTKRVKNALGEETADLRLVQTEWKIATHVNFTNIPEKRKDVKISDDEQKVLYLKRTLEKRVMTVDQLRAKLGVDPELPAGTQVLTKTDKSGVRIFEMVQFSALPEKLRKLVRTGADAEMAEVIKCDVVSATASAHIPQDDCAFVLRYNLEGKPVKIRRSEINGIAQSEIKIEVIQGTSGLMQISQGTELASIFLSNEDFLPTSDSSVKVAEFDGKEFMMRRTMQDSANAFSEMFPGSAGGLEIVKFNFEKQGLVVRRADALVPTSATNTTDRETLMIVPTYYYRIVNKDPSGTPLARPKYVRADRSEKDAMAYIDWSSNSVPNRASPIDYYTGIESCAGRLEPVITDLQNKLSVDGTLGFTLEQTYQVHPNDPCGLIAGDYFTDFQSNFRFDERVSFKRYTKTAAQEIPALTVPYDQQKQLGFGLFTYGKNKPNQFGNSDTIGTKVPLPAVYSVDQKSQIEYVLAGLPANKVVRERIISGTKKVVADWNDAFRRAFKGTPKERDTDVLVLKIEGKSEGGLDGVAPMAMGDFGRNYIYYVEKATSSGIIGLGGSHSNPRSGEVENASVFVYGGNIISYVEYLKQRAVAAKEYQEKTKVVTTGPTLTSVPVINPPEPVQPSTPGVSGGSSGRGTIAGRRAGVSSAGLAALSKRDQKSAEIRDYSVARSTLTSKVNSGELKRTVSKLAVLEEPIAANDPSVQRMLRKLPPEQRAFHAAVQRSLAERKIYDAAEFNRVLGEEQLKILGPTLDKDGQLALSRRVKRDQARQTVLKNMQAANICVFQANAIGMLNEKDFEKDEMELFDRVYLNTLSHELGHNLGLRHNFIASYDKGNWKFDDEVKTVRNYSSVMDYIADSYIEYAGPGPQDVAALRAGYAGFVEVVGKPEDFKAQNGKEQIVAKSGVALDVSGKQEFKVEVPGANGGTPTQMTLAKGLVSIESLPQALGIPFWENLDEQALSKLPIRKFSFCSDEDAGTYPLCNRFDAGTNPVEVISNAMADYRAFYSLRNFPNNKVEFSSWNSNAYISRVFGTLMPVRQFLDELFYQLVTGQTGRPEWRGYIQGAFKAMMELQAIIRTPDAPSIGSDLSRWSSVQRQLQNGGTETIPVERKYLQNTAFAENNDRLKVRGIEYDKVIASILLTERRFGWSRYEKASLAFSFPFFEQLAGLQDDETKAHTLPTLMVLKGMMNSEIQPGLIHPTQGTLVDVSGGRFTADSTEMMRVYGAIGAIVALDTDTIENRFNFAQMFRVLSDKAVPSSAKGLLPRNKQGGLGQDQFKFAYYDAPVAVDVSNKIVSLDAILDQEKAIKALLSAETFSKWSELAEKAANEEDAPAPAPSSSPSPVPTVTPTGTPAPAAPVLSAKEELAKFEADLDAKLAALIPSRKDLPTVSDLLGTADAVNAQAIQLTMTEMKLRAMPSSPAVVAQLNAIAQRKIALSKTLINMVREEPMFEMVMAAIEIPEAPEGQQLSPEVELYAQILRQIVPSGEVESQRNTQFSTMDTLSSFLRMVHPELF